MGKPFIIFLLFSFSSLAVALADDGQCGKQAGGALCPDGYCCSRAGYCGTTPAYCGGDCQSQCDVGALISEELFDEMLPHRSTWPCVGGFYTYDAFIAAANSFSGFATTGDNTTREREVAAFLAQTSHETLGEEPIPPHQPFTGGYCIVEQQNPNGDYCDDSNVWPCAPGKRYYGRGPVQLSHNYNYGQAGANISQHLLAYPELVATDPYISFETALWFWMTPQPQKPSCHDVITGQWSPTVEDIEANRLPGYGTITNIFNGAVECGHGPDEEVIDRTGFYKRYCGLFGISYGNNLDCYHQTPFPEGHSAY